MSTRKFAEFKQRESTRLCQLAFPGKRLVFLELAKTLGERYYATDMYWHILTDDTRSSWIVASILGSDMCMEAYYDPYDPYSELTRPDDYIVSELREGADEFASLKEALDAARRQVIGNFIADDWFSLHDFY